MNIFVLINANAQKQPIVNQLHSQTIYSWEEAQKISTDSVLRLRIKRKIPVDFEKEVLKFQNLQELQMSGLKLKNIPTAIWQLKNLKILNLSNNKLSQLPPQIGQLTALEQLIINRNELLSLPSEISQLNNLVYLDLWSNLIFELPKSMQFLDKSLRTIDMRVISLTDQQKKDMQNLLPSTEFLFSNSCGCVH
ncbi:MAG: hypothetical protein LBR36_09345 [Bacteroidales bacterium]|nr:hypothetical protein [Bacteroidales bacterium]